MSYTVGDGTELSPYQISTPQQLYDIRNNWNKHFVLVRDIDLVAEGVTNWEPIDGWEGVLDGQGHYIKNFNCYWTDRHTGLFLTLSSYTGNLIKIKRLGISGGDIGVGTTSNYYCGYLAALVNGTTSNLFIEDCHTEGLLDPGGDRGSGFIGIQENITLNVSRCVSNVGSLNQGRAGMIYKHSGTSVMTESYYRNDSSNNGGVGIGLSTAQYKTQSSFVGLDFNNTWDWVGQGPRLRKRNTGSVSGNVFDKFGVPTNRVVRAYDRSTGQLLATTSSNSMDGFYNFELAKGIELNVVCLDDPENAVINDLIIRAIPT